MSSTEIHQGPGSTASDYHHKVFINSKSTSSIFKNFLDLGMVAKPISNVVVGGDWKIGQYSYFIQIKAWARAELGKFGSIWP